MDYFGRSSLTFLFVFQLRVPVDANDDIEIDPTGSKGLWDRGLLNGAPNKVIVYRNVKLQFLCIDLF